MALEKVEIECEDEIALCFVCELPNNNMVTCGTCEESYDLCFDCLKKQQIESKNITAGQFFQNISKLEQNFRKKNPVEFDDKTKTVLLENTVVNLDN